MDGRVAYLSAFVDAIAAGHTDQFKRLVEGAYQAGASREELLVAANVGRSLGQVPVPVMNQAHAAIDAWDGMMGPRGSQDGH